MRPARDLDYWAGEIEWAWKWVKCSFGIHWIKFSTAPHCARCNRIIR